MIIDSHMSSLYGRCTDGNGEFLRPDYAQYSFAQIPALVEMLLGVKERHQHSLADTVLPHVNQAPKNVVLLLIDGFGYHQWLQHGERYRFLKQMIRLGQLMPITALFPSTTSASLTTINSGLTPQEHGLIEWRLYMDELGMAILTLPFMSVAKGARRDELAEKGIDSRVLFEGVSLHTRLRDCGVSSHALLRNTYAGSAYSSVSQAGATVIPYSSASDMMVLLRRHLEVAEGRSYFYVYWDEVDHLSHVYEPHSEEYQAELNGFTHLLQEEFLDKLDFETAENTVLLVTADHGHLPVNPSETIYLNDFPEVMDGLAVNPSGNIIHPWGSPRDVFLRIGGDRLDDVIDSLSRRLEGIATVCRSQEEANRGLFGAGQEHPQFRNRIGNVLVLPHANRTVWYQYPGLDKFSLRGMHGGMSREEMLTVLAFANVSELL